MKQMMDQLSMQFEMVKVMLEGKVGDERGDHDAHDGDAGQDDQDPLHGVAAVTARVQNETAKLG